MNNVKIKNEIHLTAAGLCCDSRDTALLVTICSFICWRHQRSVPRGAQQYVCTAHTLAVYCVISTNLELKVCLGRRPQNCPQPKYICDWVAECNVTLCGPGRARAGSDGRQSADKGAVTKKAAVRWLSYSALTTPGLYCHR